MYGNVWGVWCVAPGGSLDLIRLCRDQKEAGRFVSELKRIENILITLKKVDRPKQYIYQEYPEEALEAKVQGFLQDVQTEITIRRAKWIYDCSMVF